MTGIRRISCSIMGISALCSSGCITWWGPEDMRLTVAGAAGVRLTRDFGVGVSGPILGLASACAGQDIPVSGISSVEVGVYRVGSYCSSTGPGLRLRDLELPGWEPVIRVREPDEEVLVLVRCGRSSTRGMLVLAGNHQELTIVRLKGRLDELLRWGLREARHGWDHDRGLRVNEEPGIAEAPFASFAFGGAIAGPIILP